MEFIDPRKPKFCLRELNSFDGDGELDQHSDEFTVEELRVELEDLRALVHTLLTIIMEEADGVQSGNTPQIPNQPKRGYSM
ncbi:MAG: hypothetical protein VYB30_05340 [Candidatus Thermoplasmatota archaeon]|nr:hypothetical protein [Candidatus Thermoplasmatota archaeon]